jgi:DtxR family Mn-dependent transcriptional regulator
MPCCRGTGERKKNGEVPLSEAAAGKSYVVTSLQERDPKLLLFLHDAGIGPGQKLRVASQNYDQTVSIEMLMGNSMPVTILGRLAAEAVWLRQT